MDNRTSKQNYYLDIADAVGNTARSLSATMRSSPPVTTELPAAGATAAIWVYVPVKR